MVPATGDTRTSCNVAQRFGTIGVVESRTSGTDVATWEASFVVASAEWDAIAPSVVDVDAWEKELGRLRAYCQCLVESGRWQTGPGDVLAIIRHQRRELTHSDMIAWLLDPTGQHGLGKRLMRSICREVWPHRAPPVGPVSVRLEVDCRAEGHQTRADIVVTFGESIILIENKIDAHEGTGQAGRLYRVWVAEATDVRWLLLSPDGRLPVTVGSDNSALAWASLSYPRLAGMIEAALAAAGGPSTLGRRSVEQYLATLRSLFGPPEVEMAELARTEETRG